MMLKPDTRCGFVALIGAPNAGKSTLINQLVDSKVSIVTHKAQTTRARLRAIAIEGASQIIFIDTPGIFTPKRLLDEAMVEDAWEGAGDADRVVLLVDAEKGIKDDLRDILKKLGPRRSETYLALNKIDKIDKDKLLQLAQELNEGGAFAEVFFISALSGDGVRDLVETLAADMPLSPWLYPEDQVADTPMRVIASEITREKLFLRLHDEIPYASTVETENWKELKDGSIRIEQVIYVERDSQKKIALGKGGQVIKSIGSDARTELQEIMGCKVHLFLFVKVRDGWAKDPERLSMMGLSKPKKSKKNK